MYWSQLNRERQIALWFMDGPAVSPGEWDRHFDDLRAMAAWGRRRPRSSVALLFIGQLFAPPDAVRRKQIAELTSEEGYDGWLAIVSSNPLLRGALTAIHWLRGASAPALESEIFRDGGKARVWLESKRGESLPELRQMFLAAPPGAARLW